MLTKVYGSAVFGVEAMKITVEVNIDSGVGYHLVGLPDNAIKESNYRIAAALQNNSYKIPGKKKSRLTWCPPTSVKKVAPMTLLWLLVYWHKG